MQGSHIELPKQLRWGLWGIAALLGLLLWISLREPSDTDFITYRTLGYTAMALVLIAIGGTWAVQGARAVAIPRAVAVGEGIRVRAGAMYTAAIAGLLLNVICASLLLISGKTNLMMIGGAGLLLLQAYSIAHTLRRLKGRKTLLVWQTINWALTLAIVVWKLWPVLVAT